MKEDRNRAIDLSLDEYHGDLESAAPVAKIS